MKTFLQNLTKWMSAAVLLAGTIAACPAATVPQPVGFPARTEVIFDANGRGSALGYCLHERGKGAPSDLGKVQAITGRIKVHYRDGNTRSMTLARAMSDGLLKVADFESSWAAFDTQFKAHPSIERIEFETNAAVGDDTVHLRGMASQQRQAMVDQAFNFYDPKKNEIANAAAVWNAKTAWNEIRGETGETILHPLTYNPERHMRLRFDRLASQADASIVTSPGGRCLIHDLGGSEESTLQLLQRVPLVNGQRRVALVLTHADADHYRGLYAAMKSGALERLNVVIDELLIGVPETVSKDGALADAKNYSAMFRDFLQLLLDQKYQEHESFGHFARFVRPSATPLTIDPVKTFGPADPNAPLAFQVQLEKGFQVKIVRAADAPATARNDRHAFNLAVYYEHEGTAVLDMGDAGLKQIEGMIETPIDGYRAQLDYFKGMKARFEKSLSLHESPILDRIRRLEAETEKKIAAWEAEPFGAGHTYRLKEGLDKARVVKWPHHAWRPTDPHGRAVMKAFLRAVRPDRLVISMSSEPSADALSRLQDIRQLAAEAMKDDGQLRIEIMSTGKSAIEFRAMHERDPGALTSPWSDLDAG